jgi:hypothetical protein
MPDCEKCKELRKVFKIKLPAHLKQVISIAQENVADDTISVIENGTGIWSQPFSQLVATGAWDDIVQYLFKCNFCGQRFQLNAETYHGGGGEWKPLPK